MLYKNIHQSLLQKNNGEFFQILIKLFDSFSAISVGFLQNFLDYDENN